MKRLSMIVVLALTAILMASCAMQNSTTKEQRIAMRSINKNVRNYKKEGWKVQFGNPPMESQLMEAFNRRADVDERGYSKFIEGESTTVGESYNAAHAMALNISKLEIAGKIETEVTQLIATKLANDELSQKQAATLSESASASKNLVAQKLGRVITPVNIYRDLPNGNVEVRVMSFYSQDLAMDTFKQTMREDLEKKADDLAKQLDKILKF
ncbi:MAG: hypothetical protein K6A94_13210 [Bacteroidales bacterium]|nr:hypothetical protein [Bacteroidales bacterium]